MTSSSGIARKALDLKGYIIIGIALLMAHVGTLPMVRAPLEQSLIAMRDRMHSVNASGQVVVVDIDKRTLARQSWPLPRETQAKVIDNLVNAGATRIAIALDYSSKTNPQSDSALVTAISRSHVPIIIPVIDEKNDEGELGIIMPLPQIQKHARLAAINLVGENKRITHVGGPRLIKGVDSRDNRPINRLYPSFSAAVVGDMTRDYYPISSNIESDSIPRLSYDDVLNGRFSPDQVAGKNIIIGGTARSLRDSQNIVGRDNLPSTLIMATASDTLIQGPMREQAGTVPFLMVFMIIALTVFGTRKLSERMSGYSIAIAAALIMPTLLEVFMGVRFASSAALMTGVGAIVGTTAMGIVGRNYRRITQDADTGLPNIRLMSDKAHHPDDQVIVMRIDDLLPIETAFGREKTAIIMRRIHDHASMGRAREDVYLVDANHLAWRADAETPSEAIIAEIERISDNFQTGIAVGSHVFNITTAFGIAQDATLKQALSRARHAADEALKRGLQWERYQDAETDGIEWKATLLGELDRSIDEKDMWVAYQPKFSAEELCLVGAEALVRWDHPTRGNIRPDTFITIAENAGRVEKLTLYVLERAVDEISQMRARTGKDISVSVNLSAKMIGFGRLVGPVRAILEKYNLPAEALILELTETSVIARIESAQRELKALRALGISLSIDDYGTGQASLSYLDNIPANELKIDQSFIRDMMESGDKRKIVESTIQLAHDLGMHVVAEGVESPAAQHMLRDMKCDHLQGYLLGKPMRPHEFEALAAKSCVPKVDYRDNKIAIIG